MQLSHKAAVENARALKQLAKQVELAGTDLAVFPSYPSLEAVAEELKESNIEVGAQNVQAEEKGAFTGEVSVSQIKPFVTWCIIGHSEQRWRTGQSEEAVADSARLLLKHGITPIVCVGETREEKERDDAANKVSTQINVLMGVLNRVMAGKVVIAYEPIWAISSQEPDTLPDPSNVAQMAVLIRKITAGKFGGEVAEKLRVIYGGSVDRNNVADFTGEPGIDGVLPGGASLQPRLLLEMAAIVDAG